MNSCTGIFGKLFGHKFEDLYRAFYRNGMTAFLTIKQIVKTYGPFFRMPPGASPFDIIGSQETLLKKCKRCGRRVETKEASDE